MAQELFYTSVPRGLLPGSQGFCTVAATRGMQPGLVEKLESLTGYKPIYAPNDPNADFNPVGYFHYRMTISGRTSHVLGRIGAAPTDYSGRTNKFAHMIVLDSSELPDCGPAALLLDPSFLQSSWEGSPEWIEEPKRVPNFDQPASYCRQWQQMTGDAGWAGALVNAFETTPHQSIYLMYEPGEDQLVLTLFAEALALLSPEERWSVGFSTYPSNLSPGINCHWRGAVNGFADTKSLQRTGSLVWALTPQLGRAEDSALTRAAREGKAPPRDRKRSTPAASAPRPQGNFPPPAPTPSGSGSRQSASAEPPQRLSGIITNSPPSNYEEEEVRVIEEVAEPRSRSRPAPRREADYSHSPAPRERSGGIGAFWGLVFGVFVTLLGILVLELGLQRGLTQKFAATSESETTKPKVDPEPKGKGSEVVQPKEFYIDLHKLKTEKKELETAVADLTEKNKKLVEAEREWGVEKRRLEGQITSLQNPPKKEVVRQPEEKDKKKTVEKEREKEKKSKPLTETSAVRGGKHLIPDVIGLPLKVTHQLGFDGEFVELVFDKDLLVGDAEKLTLDDRDNPHSLILSYRDPENVFPLLKISVDHERLNFDYFPAKDVKNGDRVRALIQRCIIKVKERNSIFFQCIYLQDAIPIGNAYTKWERKEFHSRGKLGDRFQPRADFTAIAKLSIPRSADPSFLRLLKVQECTVEVQEYRPEDFQENKLPYPYLDPMPNPNDNFIKNTARWWAAGKVVDDGKAIESTFRVSVFGEPQTKEEEAIKAAPPVEVGQVKIRDLLIVLDVGGARVPMFQFKDPSPFKKKEDSKKGDSKKDEGSSQPKKFGEQ